MAGKSHYAATKSAMTGLSRSWAIELAPRGITCNIVAPGPTDTPMLSDPGRAGAPPKVPALGKLIDPADVAELVAFLLGQHGSSITGQTLTICGARRSNPQPHRAEPVGSSGLMQLSLPVGKQLQSREVSMG